MNSHFQILLKGVLNYLGFWENLGGGPLFSCFIEFLCSSFSKSFKGYMRSFPSACASMNLIDPLWIFFISWTPNLFKNRKDPPCLDSTEVLLWTWNATVRQIVLPFFPVDLSDPANRTLPVSRADLPLPSNRLHRKVRHHPSVREARNHLEVRVNLRTGWNLICIC